MSFLWGDEDEVAGNIKKFFEKIGVQADKVAKMSLEHKDNIEVVDWDDCASVLNNKGGIEADALITREKGLPIFLMIADCIPMIITDINNTVLSVVHGGIANTDLKLSKKTVEHMVKNYKVKASDLVVTIGPAIRKESYIYDYFEDKDPKVWEGFVEKEGDVFHIDNVGATVKQLVDCGIKEENIHDNGIDTYTDERYFSHRRDYDNKIKDKGRFAVVAMLD